MKAQLRRLVSSTLPFTIDITGSLGMGAILSHAHVALRFARSRHLDVALRFTSPIYRPSWGSKDWLDDYFIRMGPLPHGRPHTDSGAFPEPSQIPGEPHIVWDYLKIKPEIIAAARDVCAGSQFAAVHYRGTDKFIEATRIQEQRVLDEVERGMLERGLDRLFVASDEPAFIARAQQRFGCSVFVLPCVALTNDGTPPHFLNVPGEVKAHEALVTLIILSRAKLCVRTPSFLSAWAATLGDDQQVILL